MANDENLIPLNQRTKSEARVISVKGGKASGVARRRKRDMQQTLNAILDMPWKKGKLQQFRNLSEVKGKNITVEQAILLAMVNKAIKGDVKSAIFIRDTVGCKPSDHVEIEDNSTFVLTEEYIEDE
jgi:hypothetical protein